MAEFRLATPDDAPDLVRMRMQVNRRLAELHGEGHWSSKVTEKGVLFDMRNSSVYVGLEAGRLVATFTLSTRKPWSIDKKFYRPVMRPVYLTSMAVALPWQGKGIGRLCIIEARRIASQWAGDSLCLDAYESPAGAGDFYRKCGLREVGRGSYRDVPLIYFEMLLTRDAPE